MKTRSIPVTLSVFLALAATLLPARGALIYSGVQNVPIPQDQEGVYVRLSDSMVSNSYPVNWNTEPWLNPFFGGVDIANSPLLRPVVLGSGPNPEQIVNLSLGTSIGAGSNFVAGESGSATHTGVAVNQFQIGTPGLIGFVFETVSGGPDYYGWLRLTVNNAGAGNITDWAVENTPGTAVLAGLSVVPEPVTALTGVALLGVAALRRRRSRDTPAKNSTGTARRAASQITTGRTRRS